MTPEDKKVADEFDRYCKIMHIDKFDQGLFLVFKYAAEWAVSQNTTKSKCAALKTFDPPQDCDWPHCGCDPHAQRVVESLVEQGWKAP